MASARARQGGLAIWCLRPMAFAVAALLLLAGGWPATASDMASGPVNFPERGLAIIVPFAPGGGMDVCARLVAKYLTVEIQQPVTVINRTDGGNVKGNFFGVQAPADGYTLTMWGKGLVTDQLLIKGVPYSFEDVRPVCTVAQDPHIISISSEFAKRSGVTSLDGLVAYARAHPMAVTIGMGGNWTTHDFLRVKIESEAGVQFNRMPFLGGALALRAALAGNCDVVVPMLSEVLPYATDDRVRILAVSSPSRQDVLPDVMTVAEAGYPGLVEVMWRVLTVPKATPDTVVRYLETAMRRVMADPEFRREAALAGVNAVFVDADKTAETVAAEYKYYRQSTEGWRVRVRE